jgi:hypothetical protein
MRFEVFMAVKMSMSVFWVVTPCGLRGKYQRFRGTYCLHLQPWIWQYVPLKRWWCLPTSPYGFTVQDCLGRVSTQLSSLFALDFHLYYKRKRRPRIKCTYWYARGPLSESRPDLQSWHSYDVV